MFDLFNLLLPTSAFLFGFVYLGELVYTKFFRTKSVHALPSVKFVKLDPHAVTPTKGTPYSIGYDLTAINVYKKISDKTTLYDTGLAIEPPPGYYTEIVPRSSISKTGYMLSNSVGQIDWDYRGKLLIAFTKVDDSMPDIELPFVKCQLVLRKAEYYDMNETEKLYETERGDGGFGSTDNKSSSTG